MNARRPTDRAGRARRVRALLEQCCQMCAGHDHACERSTMPSFGPVEAPGPLLPAGPLSPDVQAAIARAARRPLTRSARVRLLRDGVETYQAMLDLIEDAEHEVLLENYIFRMDAVGRGYAECLERQARAGVDVRVLHDPFGDPLSIVPLHRLFAGSRAGVRLYNPPRPSRRYLRAWRDHRKLVVQDRRRLVAGGLCVADVWLGNCIRSCTWRDSAVLVEGAAAADAAREFDGLWQNAFGLSWRRRPAPAAHPADRPHQGGEVPVRILADGPDDRSTESALAAAIEGAQHEVLVTNQYGLPTPPVERALLSARRRGVAVEILLPAASRPFFVALATEHRLGRLLDGGIAVWQWNGAMLHAKTVVIDRCWSLVGSTNLDALSLVRNAELNVEIHGPAFGAQVAQMFMEDRASATRVTADAWRGRSAARRAVTQAAALLATLM